MQLAPTVGALVGRAAAVSEARGPSAGWQLFQAIPRESLEHYQPYWALASHLPAKLGRSLEARAAAERAIALCSDAAVRQFLSAFVTNRY